MKKSIFAVALLAAPGLAFAAPHGARIGIGASSLSLGMSGAGDSVSAGAVPALSLSLTSTPPPGRHPDPRPGLDLGRSLARVGRVGPF